MKEVEKDWDDFYKIKKESKSIRRGRGFRITKNSKEREKEKKR